MSVTAIPTDHTRVDRPERAVTGVNPLRARNRTGAVLATLVTTCCRNRPGPTTTGLGLILSSPKSSLNPDFR